MSFALERILIWGKTYPELSARHVETVCTGGVREDGSPIRLYPVPLRYLETGRQYRLYDWIEVPVEKSTSDPRPESFKVDADRIRLMEHVDTEKGSWATRRKLIFKDPSWHFGSVEALKAAQQETGRSLGMVTPGTIENVSLDRKPEKAGAEYERKMKEVQYQGDMFRPEYKELEFLPYDIRLDWRCAEHCADCTRNPHSMKALDWGLLELARRDGWDVARRRLEDISNLRTYDFRLYMGNFRLHAQNFGIIGLWYPKRAREDGGDEALQGDLL